MSDMTPEIWISYSPTTLRVHTEAVEDTVKYIRADIAMTRIEYLESALREISKWSKEEENDPQTVLINWRACVGTANHALSR